MYILPTKKLRNILENVYIRFTMINIIRDIENKK